MSSGHSATRGSTSIAIGGLGALGLAVARVLDQNPGSLRLIAVAVRDTEKAARNIAAFSCPPTIVSVAELADADVVVEAAPSAAFRAIVEPAVERGRLVVVASGAALLSNFDLVERARDTGATIVLPTGALGGLDAIRAVALEHVEHVTLETRKSPQSLAGAPYLVAQGLDMSSLTAATRVFSGSAREAARGFPANANVAAALALAGIGPDRTHVEIWADPNVERNIHIVRVEADAARMYFTIEAQPSRENPRTSRLAPLSVLACLRRLHAPLQVGS
jgi:aspartate dehydrogenase